MKMARLRVGHPIKLVQHVGMRIKIGKNLIVRLKSCAICFFTSGLLFNLSVSYKVLKNFKDGNGV